MHRRSCRPRSSSPKPVNEQEKQADNDDGNEQGKHQRLILLPERVTEYRRFEMFVTSGHNNLLGRVQFSLHRGCGWITIVRVSLHGVQNDFLDLGWDIRVNRAWSGRVAGEPRIHDLEGCRTLERHGSGNHLEQHGAQTINVRTLVASFSFDLFRRHEVRRAQGRGESTEGEAPHPGNLHNAEIHNPQRAICA
jgi:hypothetical protein